MGRVYKENGVFMLQYTTRDHKRKAMVLKDANGRKITEERKAESAARDFLEREHRLKEIETREEYLEEKAKLKKLKARLTITLDDAFELSLRKPHTRSASLQVLNVSRRYWFDFVSYLRENYHLNTLDEVERSHAESYIAYLRQNGRWNRLITFHKTRCPKRKKFKDYEFGGSLSATTLNRYQSVCKAVFTFLLPDLGYSVEENPFYFIRPLKLAPAEREIFTEEEFHSVRHCFCYYAGLRGVPLPVVQSIVGHLTASMTKHYQSHADRKARMQGLALMRGLTGGNHAGDGTPDSLLRQNLTEYIQTASSMEILRLNVLIAQMNDSAKQLNAEVKLLTGA